MTEFEEVTAQIETLEAAAEAIKNDDGTIMAAMLALFVAEAELLRRERAKNGAINTLLVLSDEADMIHARVTMGYTTAPQVVALAQAVLYR